MRKILFLLPFIFLGCSSDDDGVVINEANIAGKWFFYATSDVGGSVVPYENQCPDNKDYYEIKPDFSFRTGRYNSDCQLRYESEGEWELTGRLFTVMTFDPIAVPSYHIESLTDDEMILVIAEPGMESVGSKVYLRRERD